MDINKLRFFVEVCDIGSVSKAAEKLNITQQGLSSSIRRLEAELGCDLFYRKNGNFVLTDIGSKVLNESRIILQHMKRINDFCQSSVSGRSIIHLAITESLIVRLPSKLQQLLISGDDYYDVHLVESYSKQCCDLVDRDECSLGIVYGIPDDKRFNSTLIDRVKQVIIVNKNNPLAKQDSITFDALDNFPMVSTKKGTYPYENLLHMFQKNNAHLNVSYECDRPRQTIEIVGNNPLLAARTVAANITDQDLLRVKVLNVNDDEFLMPVYLISKKTHKLTPPERMLKATIIEGCRSQT